MNMQSYRHVLGGLAVVLKDDGDVHVDDDEEADDEVREQVGDGNHGVATVALVAGLGIRWKWIHIRRVEIYIIYGPFDHD